MPRGYEAFDPYPEIPNTEGVNVFKGDWNYYDRIIERNMTTNDAVQRARDAELQRVRMEREIRDSAAALAAVAAAEATSKEIEQRESAAALAAAAAAEAARLAEAERVKSQDKREMATDWYKFSQNNLTMWIPPELQEERGFFARGSPPIVSAIQPMGETVISSWNEVSKLLVQHSILDTTRYPLGSSPLDYINSLNCTVGEGKTFFHDLLDKLVQGRDRHNPSDGRFKLQIERGIETIDPNLIADFEARGRPPPRTDYEVIQAEFNYLQAGLQYPEFNRRRNNFLEVKTSGVKITGTRGQDAGGMRGEIFQLASQQALDKCVECGVMFKREDSANSEIIYLLSLGSLNAPERPGRVSAELEAERIYHLQGITICIILCIGCDVLKTFPFKIDPIFFFPMLMDIDGMTWKMFTQTVLPEQLRSSIPLTAVHEFLSVVSDPDHVVIGSDSDSDSNEDTIFKLADSKLSEYTLDPFIDFDGKNTVEIGGRRGLQHDIILINPNNPEELQLEGKVVLNLNYLYWYIQRVAFTGMPYVISIMSLVVSFYETFGIASYQVEEFMCTHRYQKYFGFADRRPAYNRQSFRNSNRLHALERFTRASDFGLATRFFLDTFMQYRYERAGLSFTTIHNRRHSLSFSDTPAGREFADKVVRTLNSIVKSGLANLGNPDDTPIIGEVYYNVLKTRPHHHLIPRSDQSRHSFDSKIQGWLDWGKYGIPAFHNPMMGSMRVDTMEFLKTLNAILESAKRNKTPGAEQIIPIDIVPLSELQAVKLGRQISVTVPTEMLNDIQAWIDSVKSIVTNEYARVLKEWTEETAITDANSLQDINALLNANDFRKVFPSKQYMCPRKGFGRFCSICSLKFCENCQFDTTPCARCKERTKDRTFSLEEFIKIVSGSRPCTKVSPLTIKCENQVLAEHFYQGVCFPLPRLQQMTDILGREVDYDYTKTGFYLRTCGGTIDIHPLGISYTSRLDYVSLLTANPRHFEFDDWNIYACVLHHFAHSFQANSLGEYTFT